MKRFPTFPEIKNISRKSASSNNLRINFQRIRKLLRTNLARLVGPIMLFISFSCKPETTKSTTAMAFRKSGDFSYKDSTRVVSAYCSHVSPITQRKFKKSGIDGSEYFTSLEMMKNNNSYTMIVYVAWTLQKCQRMVVTATPRGNQTSVFFGEFSQIGLNFGEFEDSMDSPTLMNVNALMADLTDMDEKFAMMEQTIEALKKSVDDKNLHIAQLMNKLEAFTPGELSHVPTCPPGFDQRNKDVEESLTKSKFQKEKQSASVAALYVQQLQDMITNTIRAQYGGTPQSSLYYSKLDTRRIDCLSMPTNYQPPKLQQFDGKGNPRQHIAHFVETCSNAGTHAHDMELSIASHGKTSSFVDLTKEKNEFRKDMTSKTQTKESIAVKATSVNVTIKNVPMIVDEFLAKKVIDLPESKRPEEINKIGDPRYCSLEIDDHEENEVDGWTLVTHKKRRHQVALRIRLPKTRAIRSNVNHLQPSKNVKPCTIQKINSSLSQEEKMTVPVAQVPAIALEPSKGNTQVGKVKGNFDRKVFTLFEKSGYNFSNPAKLKELRDEVTGEKIHGLTKSQMHFIPPDLHRKKEESKEGKTPRRTLVFERIGRLTPRVSAFERLGRNDERKSSKQVNGYVTTSKTSVFRHLGTKRKSSSERRLLEHENQDFCDVTDDKEIHSVFPSRIKRNDILSITTNGSLKLKRSTIVITNQCHGETKKEEDEAITVFLGSQREDSNLIQSSYHITVEKGPHFDDTNDDVQEAPPQLEDGVQSTIDDLRELNLGTLKDPRPTFISALLTPQEERNYFKLLVEYKDVFAWSYREMSGLSRRIVIHYLGIKKGTRPTMQSQRVFRLELVTQTKVEVNKLIKVGFIREVNYPLWISTIVPIKKKNGQICVCVDLRNLNKACPKDDFPFPIIELMVDATTGHEAMSFMNGSSGYNQIRMSPKDEEYTTFRTPKEIYYYKVMLFGLKNVGATYQCTMKNIFNDMFHKRVECYVDDLVVKSKQRKHHLEDLRIVFGRLRKFDLKMNPLKCAFGVTSGKFLSFIVRHRGIEVDPTKIDAIQKIPEPKNLRDLADYKEIWHSFGDSFLTWLDDRSVKELFAQENEAKKEQALYYLSRTLIGVELNYTPIEKMCLALLYATKKMRHYFEAYTIKLISRDDPVKFVMTRPFLSGRLARWSISVNQYDIIYTPQKAVKGQALANFLVDRPLPGKWETSDKFLDEDAFFTEELSAWTMFFDGSAHQDVNFHRIRKFVANYRMADALANLATTMALGENETTKVKKENVVDFIKANMIFRYGIPRCIVTDNGTPFNNKLMSSLCEKCSFKQHKPLIYNACANGLAEALNKALGNLLKKVVAKNKRDWHERIDEALWAYRTTFRTATQATLFSLVYGVEAVLSLEKQIPSL
ncbi:hypothetical protein KY290_033918 [Solanum tuberosum]|uniref:Integrase catalytic domain-containing protein n=1 Tax=Solanum tuberosum TaxID=4113 RepID=A0ABQ7U1W6_SOLTU|nr:hypothetical protein KY289_034780 [Solanum tuberosum]KAH0740875.1 hypothetical protein KY290_033918 [Solanum tuberosum]